MTEPAAYVIFSADLYSDATESEADAMRPKAGEWTLTEGDEQWDYDYLADESGDDCWRAFCLTCGISSVRSSAMVSAGRRQRPV